MIAALLLGFTLCGPPSTAADQAPIGKSGPAPRKPDDRHKAEKVPDAPPPPPPPPDAKPGDEDVIRNLDLLEKLELLDKLEIFDKSGDTTRKSEKR